VPARIVSADLVTYGKPHPNRIAKALNCSACPPRVPGRRRLGSGAKAGHEAGCRVLATLYTHSPPAGRRDWIVHSLNDVQCGSPAMRWSAFHSPVAHDCCCRRLTPRRIARTTMALSVRVEYAHQRKMLRATLPAIAPPTGHLIWVFFLAPGRSPSISSHAAAAGATSSGWASCCWPGIAALFGSSPAPNPHRTSCASLKTAPTRAIAASATPSRGTRS